MGRCVGIIVDTIIIIVLMMIVGVVFTRSTEFWISDPAVRQYKCFEEKGQSNEDFPPTANPPTQDTQQDQVARLADLIVFRFVCRRRVAKGKAIPQSKYR